MKMLVFFYAESLIFGRCSLPGALIKKEASGFTDVGASRVFIKDVRRVIQRSDKS